MRVICKMQVKLKKLLKGTVKPILLDFEEMKKEEIQSKLNIEVTNRFELPERVVIGGEVADIESH